MEKPQIEPDDKNIRTYENGTEFSVNKKFIIKKLSSSIHRDTNVPYAGLSESSDFPDTSYRSKGTRSSTTIDRQLPSQEDD